MPSEPPSGSRWLTATSLLSNLANIQSLLQNGLQKDHPDLENTIFYALDLNLVSRLIGQGSISFLGQLQEILPHPCDHRLEVYFITELFASYNHVSISDPETLLAQVVEHFEYFDDPDLKCGLPMFVSYMNTDISVQVNYTAMLHTIIQHRVSILLFYGHGFLPPGYIVGNYIWQRKKTFPSIIAACMD
jgi:hypothetical protein